MDLENKELRKKASLETKKVDEIERLQQQLNEKLKDLVSIRNGQFHVLNESNYNVGDNRRVIYDLDTDQFIERNTKKIKEEIETIYSDISDAIDELV